MPLSQKGKTFFRFCIAFLKCSWNLQHSEKKKNYPSLIITKIIASERDIYLSAKKSCFSTPFVNQRVNGFETLPKLAPHHYFSIFPWIREKLSLKKSNLVTSEIFRLFVNMLTPDDKYFRRYMSIFSQQIQTLLSQKGKTFCGFFIVFLKCTWNWEHSEKKRRVSLPNYYRNYCIRKRCLLKRLKGLASAHHSVINVLTASKHCWS